jgi:hypothetical protein
MGKRRRQIRSHDAPAGTVSRHQSAEGRAFDGCRHATGTRQSAVRPAHQSLRGSSSTYEHFGILLFLFVGGLRLADRNSTGHRRFHQDRRFQARVGSPTSYGSFIPGTPSCCAERARVSFPYRNYLLFEGSLEATAELGWRLSEELFISQSPNLFWPQDHAWCVASEIDLFCTLVAGSNELAESLIANSRLEVWRALADDPVGADSDEENR